MCHRITDNRSFRGKNLCDAGWWLHVSSYNFDKLKKNGTDEKQLMIFLFFLMSVENDTNYCCCWIISLFVSLLFVSADFVLLQLNWTIYNIMQDASGGRERDRKKIELAEYLFERICWDIFDVFHENTSFVFVTNGELSFALCKIERQSKYLNSNCTDEWAVGAYQIRPVQLTTRTVFDADGKWKWKKMKKNKKNHLWIFAGG